LGAARCSALIFCAAGSPHAMGNQDPNAGHPLPCVPSALRAGLLWSSASVAFEFLFGHYVNKDTWSELFHAYNLLDGRLWLLDVLGIAAAPGLARAWGIRDRSRRPEGLARLAVGGSVPA
jgi:hypothetical protein